MSEEKLDKNVDKLQESNGLNFGITVETKSSNFTPLKTATKLTAPDPKFPYGWQFPIATLVNVIAIPNYSTKNGDKAVLQFVFRDKDGSQHIHFEWEQDPSDAKIKEKMEGLNVRIKHLYTAAFGTFPEEGIGRGATSFADFFAKVAEAFNSVKDSEGRKVYATKNYYYKLTYFNGNLGFPLSPNFIEPVHASKACSLNINLKYDTLDSKTTKSVNPMLGGIGGDIPSDLPSFEDSFS